MLENKTKPPRFSLSGNTITDNRTGALGELYQDKGTTLVRLVTVPEGMTEKKQGQLCYVMQNWWYHTFN